MANSITGYVVFVALRFLLAAHDGTVGVVGPELPIVANGCGAPVRVLTDAHRKIDDLRFLENFRGCNFDPVAY